MVWSKFSMRTLLLFVSALCICVTIWAHREKQRLALIGEIERRGGKVDISPAFLPGLTGRVSEISVPHSVYDSGEIPGLTRFRHLKKFQLTDFKSDGFAAKALVITDRDAIRRVTDR